MEYAVYIITAVVTVGWSLWSYLLWDKQKELRGESPLRTFFMVSPSLWFIIVASAGWGEFFLRLDVIGLGTLVVIHLLSGLALGFFILTKKLQNKTYFWILAANNLLALGLAVFMHAARNYPPITIQLAVFNSYLQNPDSFLYHLLAVSPVGPENEVVTLFDKALIALLSIIPVAILRSVMLTLRLNKMRKEMQVLQQRIAAVEEKIQN